MDNGEGAAPRHRYSDVLEYYDAHEHPNRESAVAFAEAEYNPGQHFWTGLFRDVPLYEIAERLTNWYCDQESVADYLQEVLQEFVGEAAEDYYPDDDEYRLFKDDVRAAFLRLLHRPKSRPKMYQVTDVEQHRVPDDEEKEE